MNKDDEAGQWVERTLAGMDVRKKIGQLLFPILSDTTEPGMTAAGMIAEFGVCGAHYFGGSIEASLHRLGEAQAAAEIPLLISGDLDRGGGDRIKEGTLFQSQMALGAAGSEELAYALGKAIAVENRAVGYNWTFSPIVDICGIRDHLRHIAAVGDDPDQVARLTCAQIRGIQDHGMAACAKHFPGDGFDDRDQHLTTSVNPLGQDEWYRTSGRMFKAAIDAGVWSIMNSCIACPAFDCAGTPQLPVPAVLSRPITDGLLRKTLGFEGVIVTDALNMGGAAVHLPAPERYLAAFEAGNDVLLFVRKLKDTVKRFLRALDEGRITEARLDGSVRRILNLKTKVGLHTPDTIEKAEERLAVFSNSPFKRDAREIAEKSITLIRDSRNRVPVRITPETRIGHVLITNRDGEFKAETFDAALRASGARLTAMLAPHPEEIYDRVAAGEFDVVITSLFFPIQWGWVTPRAHGPYIRTIMSGYHLAHPDVVPLFVSFGSPFHLYELAFMDPFLVTYGHSPFAQEAAADALLGKQAITGRVPVRLDGFFERGEGIQRQKNEI